MDNDYYKLFISFTEAIDREELAIKKYQEFIKTVKDKELKNLLSEFKMNAKEHISLLKDKIIKLNLYGNPR